jgi:histidine triad (HIT) family protein
MNCIFCKIIKGEIPSYKIYEDEYTYAFLDIAKDVDGHTLVIPKKHVVNVLDCDADTLNHVMNTVKKICNHYVNDLGYEGCNIFNASGEAAQQTVMHLHFHIIPRKANDGVDSWPKYEGAKNELPQMHELLKIK